eukprot:Gb_32319 [translate_table: standard]
MTPSTFSAFENTASTPHISIKYLIFSPKKIAYGAGGNEVAGRNPQNSMDVKLIIIILSCALLSMISEGTQANDTMEINSILRQEMNETLVSPNGIYELGFWQPPGLRDNYYLSIWFRFTPSHNRTIAWTVQSGCEASSCTLELNDQGNLVIVGTFNNLFWSSQTTERNVSAAKLLDSGNFVLVTNQQTTVWSSFDYPSNALLPGQKLKVGQRLDSWLSQNDPQKGKFSLRMQLDENLVLYANSNPCWQSNTYKPGDRPEAYARLDKCGSFCIFSASDGHNYQAIQFYNSSLDLGNASVRRMIFLDSYGNLRMYSWDGANWQTSWQALNGSCQKPVDVAPSPAPVPTTPVPAHAGHPSSAPAPLSNVYCPTNSDITGCIHCHSRKMKRILVVLLIGILTMFALALTIVCIWMRFFKPKKQNSFIPGDPKFPVAGVGVPFHFSYKTLKIATGNFREKLGEGGFGSVYKGTLRNKTVVAVKKLEKSSQGNREFEAEVMTIGSVHHMNLVRLLGYCTQGAQHRLLVYEFMENGSLDKHIFGGEENNNRAILSWQTRFNVALGVAKGVAYCDEQCQSRIVHFDLKPENVLLDSQLQPKVSDFGLAKLMSKDQSGTDTNMRGTRGYLAPEWLADLPITVKADVYSYGQLLMEIISGRKNLVTTVSLDRLYYPLWAFQEMIKGNISNVADERLGDEFDVNKLELLLKVAFRTRVAQGHPWEQWCA